MPDRYGHPGVRAYIFGVDITDDIISWTPSWTDGRAPGTLNLSLVNLDDKYMITEQDIEALYGDFDLEEINASIEVQNENITLLDPDVYLVAVEDYVNKGVDARLSALTSDVVKRDILRAKLEHVFEDVITPGVDEVSREAAGVLHTSGRTSLNAIRALRGISSRYPFQEGDSIFHTNDAITVFARDPFTAQWYWDFCGYGTAFTVADNAMGSSVLSVVAEDPLRILRHAQITTNPGLVDGQFVITKYEDNFPTWFKSHFSNISLPELLHLLIFGVQLAAIEKDRVAENVTLRGAKLPENLRVSVNGVTRTDMDTDGAGSFNFPQSKTFVWGPASPEVSISSVSEKAFEPIDSLSTWQAAIDHQVYPSDLETRIVPGYTTDLEKFKREVTETLYDREGAPYPTVNIEKVIEVIGRNPHLYPVDYGRLMILLPASLGATNRDILLKDLIQGPAMLTERTTRLKIIMDTISRLEFAFYATPRGDIIAEMPLYDFNPEDFGTLPVPFNPLGGDIAPASGLFSGVEYRGPFAPRYRFTLDDISDSGSTFNDEQVKTQMLCPWTTLRLYESTGVSTSIGKPPQSVLLDHLIPQFGIRSASTEVPGFISSSEGATLYAHVKLNLENADARTATIQAVPRYGMGPNRPIHIEKRNFIGALRTVSRSCVWAKSMGMTLGLNYIRRWDGTVKTVDGKPQKIYSPFGGFGARPLNYALLFKHRIYADLPSSKETVTPTAPTTSGSGSLVYTTTARRASSPHAANERDVMLRVEEIIETVIKPQAIAEGLHIHISSTHRTTAENTKVKGANNSKHLQGKAVDFVPDAGTSTTLDQLKAFMLRLKAEKLSGELGWVDNHGNSESPTPTHTHVEFNITSKKTTQ